MPQSRPRLRASSEGRERSCSPTLHRALTSEEGAAHRGEYPGSPVSTSLAEVVAIGSPALGRAGGASAVRELHPARTGPRCTNTACQRTRTRASAVSVVWMPSPMVVAERVLRGKPASGSQGVGPRSEGRLVEQLSVAVTLAMSRPPERLDQRAASGTAETMGMGWGAGVTRSALAQEAPSSPGGRLGQRAPAGVAAARTVPEGARHPARGRGGARDASVDRGGARPAGTPLGRRAAPTGRALALARPGRGGGAQRPGSRRHHRAHRDHALRRDASGCARWRRLPSDWRRDRIEKVISVVASRDVLTRRRYPPGPRWPRAPRPRSTWRSAST